MRERSAAYPGWRVAAAAAVGTLLASFFHLSFPVLLKPLGAEFDWSREAVSRAYAIMTLGSAVGAPLAGALLERYGPRRVCVSSIALAGAAFASLAELTPRLWHLYAVFAFVGLVASGSGAVVYSRVVSTWFDERRGLALAVVVSGAAFGGMLHPPMTQALVDALGVRQACLLAGAAVAAIGAAIALGFVRQRAEPTAVGTGASSGLTAGAAVRTRVFWTLLAAIACCGLAMSGTVVHLQALFTDRGLSATRAAALGSAIGLASLLGRIVTGWLVDRYDAARVVVLLVGAIAAGCFLLPSGRSLNVAIAGGLLFGFGAGGELDAAPYLLSRYFGVRSMASVYGLIWAAWALAGAAGAIVMGRGFDVTGSYDGTLLAFAATAGAAALLLVTLPRCMRAPEATAAV